MKPLLKYFTIINNFYKDYHLSILVSYEGLVTYNFDTLYFALRFREVLSEGHLF